MTLRNMPPNLATSTTYATDYPPKSIPALGLALVEMGPPVPFVGTTTYKAEYTPKQGEEGLLPLTGKKRLASNKCT
jgi:hypothetical protein